MEAHVSLKSALSITLAVAILLVSLCGVGQPGLFLSGPSVHVQTSPLTSFVEKGTTVLHPSLACAGCSGGGGGPGKS